uniref:HTH psq-type domain-containing protein n=1 Tax=Acrobeloides nanus TaxID=290746 RepID=A0A914EFR7_9BILA
MALKEKVKRKSLDLAKKLDIIKKSAVTSKHQLAKDFNLPTVTIRNVLNNRENILQALEEGKNPKCKRMKPPQSPILEASLLNWIGNMLEVWPDDAIEELVQHEPIEYEPMGNELPFEVDSLVNEPEDYSAFEYLID